MDPGALQEYELVCSLTDETSYIRPDPPFAKYPGRELRWKISNSEPRSQAEKITIENLAVPRGEKKSGVFEITPVVGGGSPPYTFHWSNGSSEEKLSGVGPGIYDLLVVDSEYRSAKTSYALHDRPAGNSKSAKAAKTIKTSS